MCITESLCCTIGINNIVNEMSVQFSCSVVSDSLRPHGLQLTRPPCPSPTPRVYSNSFPLNRWCHPTISSSVVPFSSCLQSFSGSGSFPISQFFASGSGVSAPAEWIFRVSFKISFKIDWFNLLAVQGILRSLLQHHSSKHQFFSTQPSLWSNSHIHTWPLEKA